MTDHKRLLFLSVLVLGPVSLILLFRSNEGIRRSIYFWWGIFPVYLNYRFIQLLKRDLRLISHETGERLYNDTHNRFADVVKDLHYALRGYYLKNAQVLSTQAGMLPQAYMKWMTLTQDSVPSEFPPNKAREYTAKLMRDEMGLDFDEVFDFWEEKPLGIASIGEVHLCRLRKSQQYVALKIQFENIEQRFRSDMRTLKAFCAFAMPQHLSGFVV